MEEEMMWDIEDLVEKAMKEEGVDRKAIVEIMAKALRDRVGIEEAYKKIYCKVYKNILIPEMCDDLISRLYQGDEKGAKWSLEEVKSVASRLDYDFSKKPYTPEMLRAAMHIMYYDTATPLKKSGVSLDNPSMWGRLGDFFFTADDEKENRLVMYYFNY